MTQFRPFWAKKNGALEGAESRRGRAEYSDFPFGVFKLMFSTVLYDTAIREWVPFTAKFFLRPACFG
jgi:hypothetical protein